MTRVSKPELQRLLTTEPPPLKGERPRVGILVLNWNNYDATQRCLESLKKMTYPAATVYVLDNGSTDGSMDRLEKEFADTPFRMHRNGENLGFAAGCNRGIELALAEGCRYVLLLNNDCIIFDSDFLDPAIALAESSPGIGLVGGKILFWPDTHLIWSTGGRIQFWGNETHLGQREEDRGQYEQILQRTFISGALMLIKREVIEAIGMLPDAYFFGKEEWEYSTRAIRAGFVLLYHPRFSVYHEASNSHDWDDPMYAYNWTLSKIVYKRRNLSPAQYWLWRSVYSTYTHFFYGLKYALRRHRYQRSLSEAILHRVAVEALRNADIEKITGEHLREFRARIAGNGKLQGANARES